MLEALTDPAGQDGALPTLLAQAQEQRHASVQRMATALAARQFDEAKAASAAAPFSSAGSGPNPAAAARTAGAAGGGAGAPSGPGWPPAAPAPQRAANSAWVTPAGGQSERGKATRPRPCRRPVASQLRSKGLARPARRAPSAPRARRSGTGPPRPRT